MQEFISKSGKKIVVRDLSPDDVSCLFDYITEMGMEDTYILVNPGSLVTYDEEVEYVADCVEKIAKKEMIKLLAFFENELIGMIDIKVQPRRMQHIGLLGITIKKAYRGDGIGKELMRIAITQAKTKLSLNQIILGCFANNMVGLSLYTNLGFKEYGRLPKGVYRQGVYIDEVLFHKEINSEKVL